MKRLAAILAACAMVVAIALAVSWGVEKLMLLMFSHPLPRWMAGSAGVISGVITSGIVISQSRGKRKEDAGGPLTPLVRRDPTTGLRQL